MPRTAGAATDVDSADNLDVDVAEASCGAKADTVAPAKEAVHEVFRLERRATSKKGTARRHIAAPSQPRRCSALSYAVVSIAVQYYAYMNVCTH